MLQAGGMKQESAGREVGAVEMTEYEAEDMEILETCS